MSADKKSKMGFGTLVYYLGWLAALVLLSLYLISLLGLEFDHSEVGFTVVTIVLFSITTLVIMGFIVLNSIDPRTSALLAFILAYWFWKIDMTLYAYVFAALVCLSLLNVMIKSVTSDDGYFGMIFAISVVTLFVSAMVLSVVYVNTDTILEPGIPPYFTPEATAVVSDVSSAIQPSIALDGEDVVHMVWLERSLSDEDVPGLVMYRRSDHGGWTDAVAISPADKDADRPQITFSQGLLHVVWSSSDVDESHVVHRSMVNGSWSDLFNISSSTGAKPGSPSAVAGPDGTLHVVWSQKIDVSEPGIGSVVLYRSLKDANWTDAVQVNSPSGNDSVNPVICSTSNSRADVAWIEVDASEFGGYRLFHRGIPLNEWSHETLVHTSDQNPPPALSISTDSYAVVNIAWTESSETDSYLDSSQIMHAKGDVNGGFEIINIFGNSLSLSESPSLFTDHEDNLHLVWRKGFSMSFSEAKIFYLMVSKTGTVSGESLVSEGREGDMDNPKIVVDSQLRAHAVWDETHPDGLSSNDSRIVYTTSLHVPDTRPPVADAGDDIIVGQGGSVMFNGSNSRDNFGIVNFTWLFIYDEENIRLYGATPSFTFYALGDYDVRLYVRDAAGYSDDDVMVVSVIDDVPPFAHAGSDQEKAVVSFDGSASHDDMVHIGSGIANYTWTFNDGVDDVTLYGMEPSHRFTVIGSYPVNLKVTDRAGNHADDVMWVNVSDVSAPVAVAGEDLTIDQNVTVTLDGSASSDDVGVTEWLWTVVEDERTTVLEGMVHEHTFRSVGDYNVTLKVWDASGNHDTHNVTVTVNDSVDPVADAGGDILLLQGDVVLDASHSHDDVVGTGSGITNYTWEISRGDDNKLHYGMIVNPSIEQTGTYQVNLTVMDGAGRESWDLFTLTVAYAGAPYSLQDAINGSLDYETILIPSGEYQENIIIDRPLNLIAMDERDTTLIGDGVFEVITIVSDDVNITGLRISSTNDVPGIILEGVQGCNISGNILYGLSSAIFLNVSNDNIIHNNIIHNNTVGIHLFNAENNTLQGNVLQSNGNGSIVDDSRANVLRGNEIIDNGIGIRIMDSAGNLLHANIFTNNKQQAWDDGANLWNLSAAEGGGNSWSDYSAGYDDEGYGITAYMIPGGDNQDHIPISFVPLVENDNFFLYIGIATVATISLTFIYGEAVIEMIRKTLKGRGYYRRARKAERLLRKMEKRERRS